MRVKLVRVLSVVNHMRLIALSPETGPPRVGVDETRLVAVVDGD